METRRRGRDARATTESNRASSANLAAAPSLEVPTVEPPSTRSRTRRALASHCELASTEKVRNSSSGVVTRSTAAAGSSILSNQSDTNIGHRSSKRISTRRRSLQSNQSALTSSATTIRVPLTRKRTRSASHSEIESGQGFAGDGSVTPALADPSQPRNLRPAKRPRRTASTAIQSKRTAGTSIGSGPAQSGEYFRRTRAMSSVRPEDGDEEGDSSQGQLGRDEDGSNSVGSDRGTPTTLQGLLRRLGADLSDILPGNSGTSHSRLQQLRGTIASPQSNEQLIDALSELCEFLSVGTEESLVSFSVNLFVGPLVHLLRTGPNVEIKIYAARALTHMMEALPSSASAIAINGAADPLCQNLLSIEYIDLAEQSLSVLHKLSIDYPQQIVSANGFQAVLSFIDFFSIGIQRVAASTVCNLCRLPRGDAMEKIRGALPSMMRLLTSEDQRIRESAVLGFTRLGEAFRASSEKLEALCGTDTVLLENILALLVPSSPPAISPQSYSSALRLLATLSRGSAHLGLRILSTKSLIFKLQSRLSRGSSAHSLDCLNLADSLLPDIPESQNASVPTGSTSTRSRRRRNAASIVAMAAVDTKRREDLEKEEELLLFYGRTLFHTLMRFYVSSADSNARRTALSIMSKFISLASEEVLSETIEHRYVISKSLGSKMNSVRFCPFVAALLGENSTKNEALVGLAMAAGALQKLPTLKDDFVREGVVHEIVRLASTHPIDSRESNDGCGTERSGEGRNESHAVNQDEERSSEGNLPSGSNLVLSDIALRDVESVWNAVAALQRGTANIVSGSDLPSGARRLPSRSLLEFRGAPSESVESVVSRAARSILRTYLGVDSTGSIRSDILKNSVLQKLKSISNVLNGAIRSPEKRDVERAMVGLFDLLTASEGLTVYETSKSGILEALSKHLGQSDEMSRSIGVSLLMKRFEERAGYDTFSSLVALSLGVLSSQEKLPIQTSDSSHGASSASISSGLRQMTQPFKLRLRKASSETGVGSLRDYSHHVVLIEPLATMASVQEFLWPRVQDSSNRVVGGRQRGLRRSRMGETADEEDDAGSEDEPSASAEVENEVQEPQRHEERLRDMFSTEEDHDDEEEGMDEEEDEQNSDVSDEEASSGEEDVIEQGGGESDEHEHDGADPLDVDQLGNALPPFEVDHDTLGAAPARSSMRSEVGLRRDSSVNPELSSRGGEVSFRSYAAALAANIPRSGAEGSTSLATSPGSSIPRTDNVRNAHFPEQRLLFTLNGKPLGPSCSILTAIIQTLSSGQGISPRLWSEVHTLSYARYQRGDTSTLEVPSRSSREATLSDGSGPVRRSLRLQESKTRLEKEAIPRSSCAIGEPSHDALSKIILSNDESLETPGVLTVPNLPSSISSVVNILRLLNWIFHALKRTSNSRKAFESVRGSQEEQKAQFVSHRLSAKLMRQLSDPLSLCGGVIPSWCFTLTRESPFLFPFEVRRILFQSTSLGVPRALLLLQSRNGTTGLSNIGQRVSRSIRDSEARIARITRQKVRVHRNRILESAIKVMNKYSSQGTVIEAEYFGEVGTGLGPTLEFYTLTSREIQRVDLGLWRCSADRRLFREWAGSSDEHVMEPQKTLAFDSKAKSRRHRGNITAKQTSSALQAAPPSTYVVPTGNGLFPSCLPVTSNQSQKEFAEKITALFAFIGRLVGKAIIDSRLLDLRFSSSFARLLLSYCRVIHKSEVAADAREDTAVTTAAAVGRGKRPVRAELKTIDRGKVWETFMNGTSALDLLANVDPQLASSLNAILTMLRSGQGHTIPNLCLTFVLPGDDDIQLVKDGANKEVEAKNAEDFVKRVAYHVLFGGVYQQAEALLSGLDELIDITNLLVFQDGELELFICGPAFESWTVDYLVQVTRCDHGYSHESSSVLHLLKIMSELEESDQQQFVRFITGAPALPLGGLKNLHPRLTIVRRTPEAGRSPDECLPTVMTCTNYLKLPDYSTMEIAKKQIMYAVKEGQGAFHLS